MRRARVASGWCSSVLVALLAHTATAGAQVTYQVVADLHAVGASVPLGGLVEGPDGAYYGTTAQGGSAGCGTIYRLQLPGSLSVVHSFTQALGCSPYGDLTVGPDGRLYGVTYVGGQLGLGTVFAVTPAGQFDALHHFTGAGGGSYPLAGLLMAPNGLLYGTSDSGVIYTISPAGQFNVVASGYPSQASLTLGSDGLLYGTTRVTSASQDSIFKMTLDGSVTVLHALPSLSGGLPSACPEGAQVLSEVVEGADGQFYATTSLCGPQEGDAGTVFRVSQDGTLTTLHAFSPTPGTLSYPQAGSPWAGLTRGTDGQFYGVATIGGAGLNGGLFRVSPDGAYELLRSFEGTDGSGSQEDSPLEIAPGVFLGTTAGGIVYRLTLGQPMTYRISGSIRDLNGSPVAGISMTLTGSSTATVETDEAGTYVFTGLAAGGTYSVTPARPLFAFSPASRTFANLSQDQVAPFFVVTEGVFTRYFAEGATGEFFTTEIALLNATGTPADAVVTFQKPDGTSVDVPVSLNGLDRRTIDPAAIPGLENTALSTVIRSTQPLIADRTMRWDGRGYGSHTETSIAEPRTQWYLAEGATRDFDLFYLVQNPNPQPATVQVTYLLPAPQAPIVKNYTVTGNSRFNIWVDVEQFDTPNGPQSLLASAELSAAISSDLPVIVERAMYLTRNGRQFDAGHESAASPDLSTTWFLAEGATGPFFDLFALIANPSSTEAQVEVTYLLPGSSFSKAYMVPARSRFNIWADVDDPRLADTAVSMALTSTNGVPILVERAMWWPGTIETWVEGHNSRGAIKAGEKWGLADGQVGGALGIETYVLIANTSPFAAAVRATVVFDDGTTATQTYAVPASSRFNVPVGLFFPDTTGRRFGVVVESLPSLGGTAQIVVERASYNDATVGGEKIAWAAGGNAFGTRLR